MQEFQPISGLAGRLFGGGAAAESAGLLRHAAAPEEVRCPRCDSANTKFCYYNNYNLSQPRHFCKACRRYWTKGGLLRNVPVGGGCRKPKRKAAAATSSSSDVVDKDGANPDAKNARSVCSSGSSSSPTAAVSSASTNTVDLGVGAAAHSTGGSLPATGFGPGTFLPLQPPAPMFADQAAAFASLFGTPLPAYSFSAQPQRKAEDDVAPEVLTLTEQPSSASSTADMAPFSVRSSGVAAAASASDWPAATVIDAGMFDLAGDVGSDTSSYWNSASWTGPDGTVYLP